MMKRFSAWYDGLRPIEDHLAAGRSQRTRNNVRAAIMVIGALPGIALVESHFINRPWRDFGPVDIRLPEPATGLDVGQPWPSHVPTTPLSELLPQDLATLLPADAAVPQGQGRLTVFSAVEEVESLNTPVSQSWLSSLSKPAGDTVTTRTAVWCGFDLEKSPAERLCIATVPIPLFGRITSAACLLENGFALYHTLLRSDICESGEHENICSRLTDWNNDTPTQGQIVKIDDLQCSASMILPYLTLTMTHDGIAISSESISPYANTLKPDAEHGPGFARSLTLLAHPSASAGEISWTDLLDDKGAIPVSMTPQTRAAGLRWTEYRSRHDIKRGNNAKDPQLKGSVSLRELNMALQPPSSLQTAAQFLGQVLPMSGTTGNRLPGIDTSALPEACTTGPERPTVDQSSLSTGEDPGYRVSLSQTVCPDIALRPALFEALFTR